MTATTHDQGPAQKGVGGLYLSGITLFGMLLIFFGERLVLETPGLRAALDGIGFAMLLGAFGARLMRRAKLPQQARPIETLLAVAYLLGIIAILIYAAQVDLLMERLRAGFSSPQAADRYVGALSALWPVVWICSVLPMVFMELSYAPMALSRTIDPVRVRRSAQSGLILAMSLCILFALNFMAGAFNKKVDLSYFKTTRPSESSQKMVKNLNEKVEALLFFPGANEVQEQVESYFSELSSASEHFVVRRLDHALEPTLAKEYSVSDNGAVVLARGKKHEPIQIGTTLERAKGKLKKLDGEFQSAFAKLGKAQKTAYFTVGHEEYGRTVRDDREGAAITTARDLLTKLNYQIRDLGIGQGLASGVPDDASVVVIAGPRKPFMPAEIGSLTRYLKNGGKAMVLLDPEAGLEMKELLGPFGLKFVPTRLANDAYYVRVTHTPADRHNLFSNRFSTHPSVGTLSRNSHRLATVLLGAGRIEEIPSSDPALKPQVQFTVHSMPSTWNDENNDRNFDPGAVPKEQRRVYEMAAVVTLKSAGKGKKDTKKPNNNKDMRLVVVADADWLTDRVFRNVGNGYLFLDGLRWMVGEEDTIGETSSEEDVRIVHTRKEDVVWFYLTIFGVPALVLAAGLTYTRRQRRKKP